MTYAKPAIVSLGVASEEIQQNPHGVKGFIAPDSNGNPQGQLSTGGSYDLDE